jgi:hypothetical protein
MITETGVQAFWEASLAWKRVPGFVDKPGMCTGRLFEILHPLETQDKAPALKRQASDLSSLIVRGRCRRKKKEGKVLDLLTRIQKSGQDTIAAQIAEADEFKAKLSSALRG